jgi:DNA-binding MarR family transcriptional regulator
VSATPPERPRGLLINTWIAAELVKVLLDRNLAEDGVDADFYGTLSVIGVWGPLTPSKVADLTGTPLTTVSDRLRRMVGHGTVERVAHPDDGRSHRVQLTEAGQAYWRRGWPALQRSIAQVEANLEHPAEDVEDALEDLIGALRKASTEPSPVS